MRSEHLSIVIFTMVVLHSFYYPLHQWRRLCLYIVNSALLRIHEMLHEIQYEKNAFNIS